MRDQIPCMFFQANKPFLICVCFFISIATCASDIQQPNWEVLEKVALDEMQANQIPGAAIAVVLGDKVVYSKGLGVSSIKSQEPVARLSVTLVMFNERSCCQSEVCISRGDRNSGELTTDAELLVAGL
jgi:hypothetical protein